MAETMHAVRFHRVALRWLWDHSERELGLRLAAALGYFWEVRAYLREEEVLRLADEELAVLSRDGEEARFGLQLVYVKARRDRRRRPTMTTDMDPCSISPSRCSISATDGGAPSYFMAASARQGTHARASSVDGARAAER